MGVEKRSGDMDVDAEKLEREIRRLRKGIKDAVRHVYHDLTGKHEQDRKDAAVWLAQWDK